MRRRTCEIASSSISAVTDEYYREIAEPDDRCAKARTGGYFGTAFEMTACRRSQYHARGDALLSELLAQGGQQFIIKNLTSENFL